MMRHQRLEKQMCPAEDDLRLDSWSQSVTSESLSLRVLASMIPSGLPYRCLEIPSRFFIFFLLPSLPSSLPPFLSVFHDMLFTVNSLTFEDPNHRLSFASILFLQLGDIFIPILRKIEEKSAPPFCYTNLCLQHNVLEIKRE